MASSSSSQSSKQKSKNKKPIQEESSRICKIWCNSNSKKPKKSEETEGRIIASSSSTFISPSLLLDKERNQAFRRKFLLGLQFYCENPSLILNSDLPADLVEFVTGQGFPVEALGVILEIKKASLSKSSQSSRSQESFGSGFGGDTELRNPQRLTEISRKLVEYWMSSDSCAEALVSLSLGDEIPGLIAETTNFNRLLFAIPDCFHLTSEDFLQFVLNQCYLTIQSLVYEIREAEYTEKIRSQPLSLLLDRVFLRFYSDSEYFYTQTTAQGSSSKSLLTGYNTNVFHHFFTDLKSLCEKDFIAQRLVSKVILGFGSHTAVKLAKTVFLVGCREKCAATNLFSPSNEFLLKSPVWKHTLNSSIPLKTPTKSKLFWANWAYFIHSQSENITDVWQTCVKNWESLCLSSAVNVQILIPATYALVALGREIKYHHGEKSAQVLFSAVKVFDSVAKCLDSTSEEKKACGMALAQVMGDLHTFRRPNATANPEEKENPNSVKLQFPSSNPVFHELVDYYENGFTQVQDIVNAAGELQIQDRRKSTKHKIEVLDSDDEIEDDDIEEIEKGVEFDPEEYVYSGPEVNEFVVPKEKVEVPLDERLMDYRKKGKLPTYFSEIVEMLVEDGGQNKNEGEVEALKCLCVMKIPILLNLGVRIDQNMAQTLLKCLMNFESATCLEIPILFAIIEISNLYPQEVFETLAKGSFDKDHYTSGFRMILLSKFAEVILLLSKAKCFSCYSKNLDRHRSELMSFCPEFFHKYFEVKKQLRFCPSCAKGLRKDQNSSNAEAGVQYLTPTASSSSTSDLEIGIETLTWKEIVDRRVKAKTRYFVTPKRKTPLLLPDEYSSKLVPFMWASMANRIISNANLFLDEEERKIRGAPQDTILAQMFRILGRIILGTGGPSCPHLGNIAIQVGDLVKTFINHPDAQVRQAVLALLAVILTISDGATYVIEAVSSGQNIFEILKILRTREPDEENQALLDHTLAFLAQASTMNYRLQFDPANSTGGRDVPSQLRILPDIL